MDSDALQVVYFDDDIKRNLSDRLKRIEGQVRGIERMLQADEACPKVLNQLAATQAALRSVSTIVLRNYMDRCVSNAIHGGDARRKEAVLDEFMDVLRKFGK